MEPPSSNSVHFVASVQKTFLQLTLMVPVHSDGVVSKQTAHR